MSLAHQVIGGSVRLLDNVLHPGAVRRASKSHNFLLPQFQTALGTVVHATPLVEALKQALPDARIIVAGGLFAQQVYGGNPNVEEILDIPSPLKDLQGSLRAVRAAHPFHGEPYTTLFTTGNERTRVTLWAILAGASRRIGFSVIPEMVHTPVTWDPAGSQISNNLRILEALGLRSWTAEPRIYPSAEAIATAEERLQSLGSFAGRRRIAMVTQTSPTQRKSWRAPRWAALANHLIQERDADLIFVGTAGEAPAIEALRQQIPSPTISIAGQTGIGELAAFFRCCDLGVTLDTGPLHVGRAVGLPMVVIAPAWSPPHEWLPIDNPAYRIFKNADMRPPAPEDYIIDEVSVGEVMEAVDDLIATQPLREDRA